VFEVRLQAAKSARDESNERSVVLGLALNRRGDHMTVSGSHSLPLAYTHRARWRS